MGDVAPPAPAAPLGPGAADLPPDQKDHETQDTAEQE